MSKFALPALTALLLTAFSANATAAGLQYWQQNASGLGVAYAGSAAVGDNASTVYFDPAAMTMLPGIQVSLGAVGAWPSYQFANAGIGLDGGDAGLSQGAGNGYVTWQAMPDLALGLGISQPFGLGSDYDANSAGRRRPSVPRSGPSNSTRRSPIASATRCRSASAPITRPSTPT